MANVPGAYCAVEDLRTGDIAMPSHTTPEQLVKNAAEEIEAALGHLYVTPFEVDASEPENRPTLLLLKKINWLLASGRFILDAAAAGESTTLHAYGKRMLDEANSNLATIASMEFAMVGADRIDTDDQKSHSGPSIHNEDSSSLVEGFYIRQRATRLGESYPFGPPAVVPYG